MSKALSFYKEEISKREDVIKSLDKIINIISIIRLVIVLATIGLAYYFYKSENLILTIMSIIMGIILFLIVAIFHNRKISLRKESRLYIEINNKGINRIEGNFKNQDDNGKEYLDEKHGFTSDLDIFGRNSLFQMINSTKTKFGRERLKDMLSLRKTPKIEEILANQESIKELGKNVEWRQELEVKSTLKKSGVESINDLLKWAEETKEITLALKVVPYIFISITAISIFLVISNILPVTYLILIFMINYVVVKLLTKDLAEIINLFSKHKKDIEAYTNIIELIEKKNFKSSSLNKLKERLSNDNKDSLKEMKSLKSLVDWLGDSTGNAYYLILNVTILSDTFILKNLEQWRKVNGKNLKGWLEAMGEFEALSSISNLAFDFEEWSFPEIVSEDKVEGVNIAHPLLGEKAVSNSFKLSSKNGVYSKVALITGSNMSGKSTFLRTIGLNLLLSYIGAPVCAKSFSCSIFNIYTCMRTKDNLEENISSFYAEILRIKILIEAAKKGEKVFFLLDEIFKGTNSRDRHEGAKVLINQLVKNGAMGLVSTHDLELCDLEETRDWLKNYNFQEYYQDNKIKFDYTLREGKSKTQNAVHLMKLAGINFDNN
ncbi:MAG: DNA mismatch repair protein MutS [Clostridium sp.]|nr:DNA mismatch repair protein MutS [Clostridium sp.]